ncbi:hypothetical protein A2U01_0098924, partial [Trifolium medium]|nr:hypothetical protein [Trifolium medium]
MVEEETLKELRFDRGRVKVRLPVATCGVDEVVHISSGGIVFPVRIL